MKGKRERTVMRGQVACVYGLMFVGTTYADACKVIGVDRTVMRQYIQQSWRRPRLPVKYKALTPVQRCIYTTMRDLYGSDRAVAELAKLVPPGAAAPNTQEMSNG